VRDIAAATGLQSGSWCITSRPSRTSRRRDGKGLQQALERIEAIAREQLPPREYFRALVRTHLDTLLGPGRTSSRCCFTTGARSTSRAASGHRAAEALRAGLGRRDPPAAALRRLDDADARGPADDVRRAQLIVQWYRPRGPLSVAQLVDEAEKFFLRTPARRPAAARVARRKPRA